MAERVIMPSLGLTMDEGTILEWLKHEGDSVSKDDALLVVETDKAALEVPRPMLASSSQSVPRQAKRWRWAGPSPSWASPARRLKEPRALSPRPPQRPRRL